MRKKKNLLSFVKKNYFLIILVIGIVLITIVNLNLRYKLKKCSDNRLDSNIEKINMLVDSLEGFSLPRDLIIAINNTNIPKNSNLNDGMLIFTKSEKSCGKCLLSIISIWFKNKVTKNIAFNMKPIIFLNQDDPNFLDVLESTGYNKNLLINTNTSFVNYTTPSASEGVCLFINKEGKILFAEELRLENTEQIERTFQKIIHYLNNTTLNENNQISEPIEYIVAH